MGELVGRLVQGGRAVRLTYEDGVIADLCAADEAEAEEAEAWIAPGLVDLQVNGASGIDLNDDDLTPGRVCSLAEHHWRAGVTAWCPTLVSASEEAMAHRLAAIAGARRMDPRVAAALPLVHLEGPYLSPEDGARGAHAVAHLRPPDLDEIARLQVAAEGAIGMVTVAPELPGALELIRSLTLQGLIVAIGHTSCTAQDVTRAVDAGARLSVHLGNGAPAVLARHPNHLWEQLADDRLAASFIADGHHLPAATLTAMLRAKGVERSILVSDSTAFTGMPPGEYEAHIGGRVALTGDRRLSMAGTPYLAGSAVGLVDCVAGAVRHGGVSLGQAVQMASANPNGLLGRAGAAVRVGAPADVTVLAYDADRTRLEVVRVLLAGCVVGGGEG